MESGSIFSMFFSGTKSNSSKTDLIHLKLTSYWHRPGGGLQEVWDHTKKKGLKSFANLEKEYIELYVGSFLTLALQNQESLKFWIAKPISDPPDLFLMTIDKGVFTAREVEVTRSVSIDRTLIDTILEKDKLKYPDKYILVCYIEVPGVYDLLSLSQELSSKLKNLKNVVLVFHGTYITNIDSRLSEKDFLGNVSVVQIQPVFHTHQANLFDSIKEWQKDKEKLVHVRDGAIYWGLRPGETNYPKII